MNKYLPSRQFFIRIGILIAIIAVIAGIYELVRFVQNRKASKSSVPGTTLVVKNIVQKDSNGNGIADWEESLWGLDPTKNGDSNKEFILAKRQALNSDTNANADLIPGQSTPENQALAQDFFAAIVSLQQTGNLDEVSLKAITDAIGDKITANPIPDIYSESMIKEVPGTIESRLNYIADYAGVIEKYRGSNIGYELSFVSTGLKNRDQGALSTAQKVADSYRAFGKDLIGLTAPTALASTQALLANDYEKVGQSLDQLTRVYTDPIVGMKGLINYKKYSDALLQDSKALTDKIAQQ